MIKDRFQRLSLRPLPIRPMHVYFANHWRYLGRNVSPRRGRGKISLLKCATDCTPVSGVYIIVIIIICIQVRFCTEKCIITIYKYGLPFRRVNRARNVTSE